MYSWMVAVKLSKDIGENIRSFISCLIVPLSFVLLRSNSMSIEKRPSNGNTFMSFIAKMNLER